MAKNEEAPAGLTPEKQAVKADAAKTAYAESLARNTAKLAGLAKDYTITGLRISDPKDTANGAVVTFDPAEAEIVIQAVRKVLVDRK